MGNFHFAAAMLSSKCHHLPYPWSFFMCQPSKRYWEPLRKTHGVIFGIHSGNPQWSSLGILNWIPSVKTLFPPFPGSKWTYLLVTHYSTHCRGHSLILAFPHNSELLS
jgi:hypothetical protein